MMTPSTPSELNQIAENHLANQIQPSLRVLDENFDDSRVIGKTLSELELDGELNWMGAYPIVEQRESVILPSGEYRFFNAPTQVVTGIVDANAPETFNIGQWRVVDDLYAEAIEDGDDDGE